MAPFRYPLRPTQPAASVAPIAAITAAAATTLRQASADMIACEAAPESDDPAGAGGAGPAGSRCFAARPPSPAESADFSSSRCVSSLVSGSLGLGPSLVRLGPRRRFTRLVFFWSGSGLAGLSRISESPDVPAAAGAAARLASSCAGPSCPPSAFCVHAGDVASSPLGDRNSERGIGGRREIE